MTPKPTYNEINIDKVHSNYERWQMEKFGNVLEESENEDEEDDLNEILSDYLIND